MSDRALLCCAPRMYVPARPNAARGSRVYMHGEPLVRFGAAGTNDYGAGPPRRARTKVPGHATGWWWWCGGLPRDATGGVRARAWQCGSVGDVSCVRRPGARTRPSVAVRRSRSGGGGGSTGHYWPL